MTRRGSPHKEREGQEPIVLTITVTPGTQKVNIDHPQDLLLCLQMLNAAQKGITDQMSEHRLRAMNAAQQPKIQIAGAGSLPHLNGG